VERGCGLKQVGVYRDEGVRRRRTGVSEGGRRFQEKTKIKNRSGVGGYTRVEKSKRRGEVLILGGKHWTREGVLGLGEKRSMAKASHKRNNRKQEISKKSKPYRSVRSLNVLRNDNNWTMWGRPSKRYTKEPRMGLTIWGDLPKKGIQHEVGGKKTDLQGGDTAQCSRKWK